MREILFRGKRTDNGEWVFGDVFKMRSFGEIQTYISTEPFMLCNDGEFDVWPIEVIPETVGQFTGLYDIEGTKVFEGDVVQYNHNHESVIRYGAFNCSCCDGVYGWWSDGDCDLRDLSNNPDNNDSLCTVIGNIHDNPELVQI